jgi:PncC family amidohydrolase
MTKNDLKSGEPILHKVHHLLSKQRLRVAVAESCTGGMLSEYFTTLSGASDIFVGGIVCYSNEAKKRLLSVSEQTLAKFGAVSENTALEMINGLSAALKADIYLAITGIAGPTGGSETKPVGTVYIATKFRDQIFCHHFVFEGDREQVRQKTTKRALQIIYDFF